MAPRPTYDALAAASAGLTVAELLHRLPVSESTIGEDLARLRAGGLITASRDSSGRPGRPTERYHVSATATPGMEFAHILARVIAGDTGADQTALLNIAARSAARTGSGDLVPDLLVHEERRGFSPRVDTRQADRRAGRVRITPDRCPFAELVTAVGRDPVCTVHRGMVSGIARADGGDLVSLELGNPIAGGCQIVVQRTSVDDADRDARPTQR